MIKPTVIVAIRLNKPKVEITTGTLNSFAMWSVKNQEDAKDYTIYPAYTLEAIKAVEEVKLTAILLNKPIRKQIYYETAN